MNSRYPKEYPMNRATTYNMEDLENLSLSPSTTDPPTTREHSTTNTGPNVTSGLGSSLELTQITDTEEEGGSYTDGQNPPTPLPPNPPNSPPYPTPYPTPNLIKNHPLPRTCTPPPALRTQPHPHPG